MPANPVDPAAGARVDPAVDPAPSSRGTPPAERLLNLVIALVNTSASMTKQQVRGGVAGYGDAPSTEAFERMFERDKDTLRALGIPIVTVDAGGHSDEVGYRIDNDAYALGAVDLTPAELGVVALAAQLWSDKTLRTDMSRAMTKLRAAGAGRPRRTPWRAWPRACGRRATRTCRCWRRSRSGATCRSGTGRRARGRS
ncbi:helix-turn-helix transcriptional regulator [Promicromonospora sp. Marseille-Q5078]